MTPGPMTTCQLLRRESSRYVDQQDPKQPLQMLNLFQCIHMLSATAFSFSSVSPSLLICFVLLCSGPLFWAPRLGSLSRFVFYISLMGRTVRVTFPTIRCNLTSNRLLEPTESHAHAHAHAHAAQVSTHPQTPKMSRSSGSLLSSRSLGSNNSNLSQAQIAISSNFHVLVQLDPKGPNCFTDVFSYLLFSFRLYRSYALFPPSFRNNLLLKFPNKELSCNK